MLRPATALILALAALLVSGCVPPVEYPAREAAPLGSVRIAEPDATTGWNRATGFTQPGDALDFTVHAAKPGLYRLDLVYSTDAPKRIPVLINGSMQGSRLFPKTTGRETKPFGRIRLNAGTNTIRIGTDWGYADIASLLISPSAAPREFRLRPVPVNPRASAEARALFTRLITEFGHRTFTGQHESDVRTPTRLAQLAALTDGAAPAILGLDLQLDSATWTNPEPVGAIDRALDWSRDHRGIVTLSWHWLAPLHPSPLAWDSFSTTKTPFDVSRIADESSPEYAAILRDLDNLAEKLKRLRDARVPVLWRPLHEAEGRWFWWGAQGPEATKRLYRLMFDRFTRVHHLNNLIWVWTTTDNDTALDWYPGDNYVDILAADLYYPTGTRGDFFTTFDRIRELYRGRKPIALGECGALPNLTADAPWLWFLAWDDFIIRPNVNPPDFVHTIYRNPRSILLKGAQSASPAPLSH